MFLERWISLVLWFFSFLEGIDTDQNQLLPLLRLMYFEWIYNVQQRFQPEYFGSFEFRWKLKEGAYGIVFSKEGISISSLISCH